MNGERLSPVWHAEVHCVRPERRVGQRRSDGWVVQESLFFHHGELVVAAHAQVRRPKAHHAVVGQVRVFLRDYAHTSHFLGPVFDGGVAPKLFVVVVSAKIDIDPVRLGQVVQCISRDSKQYGHFGAKNIRICLNQTVPSLITNPLYVYVHSVHIHITRKSQSLIVKQSSSSEISR